MAVTCRDIMDLDVCSRMKLIGGKDGLGRVVRWTYIKSMETLDSWVHGHELIFVIGNQEDVSEEGLLDLLREAVRQESAGVCLLVGDEYIRTVPRAVVRYADGEKLPLFTLPFHVKLIDITQGVSQYILEDQERCHGQGLFRQNTLLELLLENPGKEDILAYCWMKLRPLTDSDKVMKTEYVKTLQCYVETDNDLLHSSEKMYIHRNTMVNRMKKINALLGCNMNDCDTRSEYYNIFRTLEYYGQL